MKKKKEKETNIKKEEKKRRKILKIFLIVCGSIVTLELLGMLILYLKNEHKINYLDSVNNIKLIDDKYYLVAGSSNYRYSNDNDMKIYKHYNKEKKIGYDKVIMEQAKLAKYDLNMNLLWEKTFNNTYDSTYYDMVKLSDGIIAVGSYVKNYEQIDLITRDGLIVKYDLDGKVLWHKNYQVLGDTELYKIVDVNDGLIVIGQSIYENMEIGNHDMGGGIILKYDYNGNMLWTSNYGGNKSGSFNDIIVLKDGYIVAGKDGSNYGMLVKFSLNGKRIWTKNTLDIAVTDNVGFNNMFLYNDKIYIASSVNTSSEKNSNGDPIYSFDACIYVYNLKGDYVTKYKYDGAGDQRFNDLYIDDTGILAIGHTVEESIKYGKQTGIIVKFSFDKEIISEELYGGLNYDVLSSITLDQNNNYVVSGYSNSFGNKKDFKPILKKITRNELVNKK